MDQYNGFTPRAASALAGAQQAAQQAGHTYIGSEHLLLALLREGAGAAYTLLAQRRLTAGKAERALLQMVGRGHPTLLEPEETTVHYRAAMEEALREAQAGGFLQAGTEHLLLALCGQEGSGAMQLMQKLGVDAGGLCSALRETIRLEQCEQNSDRQPPRVMGKPQRQTRSVMLDRFGRELTEQARLGKLDPVIGRERETERLLQILSRRSKNNPCLIGEAGVGKTAVVEGLAQRIAEGRVPLSLADKRIITLDLPAMVAGTKYRGDFEERIRSVMEEVADAGDEQAAEQLAVTDEVLSGLDCGDIPQLVVYNKCDTANLSSFDPDILLTSAKTGRGLPELLAKLDDVLAHRVRTLELVLPYDKLALADILRSRGSVAAEEYREDGVFYRATVKIDDLHRFEPFLV